MRYTLIIIFMVCSLIFTQQCNPREGKAAIVRVNYDSIKVILEDLYDSDQNIRQQWEDAGGFDSPESDQYLAKMRVTDDVNEKKLLLILKKYGWIPKSKVGYKASEAIYCVVQHSNFEMMNTYFPQLDSLAKIGEADKIDAAHMEDRLLLNKGLKQKYGSQLSAFRKDGKRAVWPIQNPEQVDSLRKTMGFELSVSENAKRFNAIYDPTEQLPVK